MNSWPKGLDTYCAGVAVLLDTTLPHTTTRCNKTEILWKPFSTPQGPYHQPWKGADARKGHPRVDLWRWSFNNNNNHRVGTLETPSFVLRTVLSNLFTTMLCYRPTLSRVRNGSELHNSNNRLWPTEACSTHCYTVSQIAPPCAIWRTVSSTLPLLN